MCSALRYNEKCKSIMWYLEDCILHVYLIYMPLCFFWVVFCVHPLYLCMVLTYVYVFLCRYSHYFGVINWIISCTDICMCSHIKEKSHVCYQHIRPDSPMRNIDYYKYVYIYMCVCVWLTYISVHNHCSVWLIKKTITTLSSDFDLVVLLFLWGLFKV